MTLKWYYSQLWRPKELLYFNCSSDVHQIRVLFAYNKTQTRINNIIMATVHLISLLSVRTQAHLWEGGNGFKSQAIVLGLWSQSLKQSMSKRLLAVLWIMSGHIRRSFLKRWGSWILLDEGLISPCWGRSVMCVWAQPKLKGRRWT